MSSHEHWQWSAQRRLKEHLLIRRNRTKHANFLGSPLFQALYNIKTEKQTIQLALCQLDARKLSSVYYLFFCFYVIHSLKKGLPQKFSRLILFRPINKSSF